MASKSNGNLMRITRSSTHKSKSMPKKKPLEPINRNTDYRRQPATDLNSSVYNEKETIFSKIEKLQSTPSKQRNYSNEVNEVKLGHLSPVTPPKRTKIDNYIHNAQGMTPSGLLKKLVLTNPIKETKKDETLDTLSDGVEQENTMEVKGESNRTKEPSCAEECHKYINVTQKPISQYQNARKALHINVPTDMPGREKEIEEVQTFIENHLENKTSGSIYISGPPGTGKTASLNLIFNCKDIESRVQKIYINCTAIQSATAVYSRLNKELRVKVSGKSEKDNLSAFERYLRSKHKTLLMVLDEIDQLETKNHSILYTVFEWPSRPNSGIILVGIANALDLTDRMLPRLQARCELKPKLLHFAPYTKDQIIYIFTSRLKAAGVLEVFSPIALQMLAGKVASISGDVRRALDIGRRVVEIIDENKKDDILQSVENFTSGLDKEVSKKVNVQEILSVLSNVYGTSQNLADDTEETFPLQQKIVVCALLLMLKKAKNKDITVGKLHEVYSRVCVKRNLTAVDQAEFVGLCSLIETKGIIKVSGRKEPRMHKVILEWNENEVSEALKDKQLISTILQDETCLGKRVDGFL